jgi:hypothetical protein
LPRMMHPPGREQGCRKTVSSGATLFGSSGPVACHEP